MKTSLLTGLFVAASLALAAQDIPLFTQKLTNSLIYNPAVAGHTFGSLTYAYRQNYANVPGAPKNHFVSLHAPFGKYNFGAGVNLFQEDVNFIRNTYASAAFAYHVHFNKLTILSAGVSAEYNSTQVRGTSNTETFEVDPVLTQLQNGDPTFDYSFGVHFQSRFFKGGIALNRLSTAWINKESSNLSNYYSAYLQGLIPVRAGEDLLEPYVAYRKFSETNNTYDVGLYYTYDNKLIAGAAYRKGNVLNATLGIKFAHRLMIGYSREMITGNIGGYVGSANEITLRFDFNDYNYKDHFRADYRDAMAYRRKTLSPAARFSARNPKQLTTRKKSLTPYSPNNRYQNTKKLSMGRKTMVHKGYKAKKSFNPKKRRKANYRRYTR